MHTKRTSVNLRTLTPLLVALIAACPLLLAAALPRTTPPDQDHDNASDTAEMLLEFLLEGEPPTANGGDDDDDEDDLELETLKFFIEFNETDEDIGVQTLLGGEPYKRLRAFDPNGRQILDVKPKRSLKKQGLSDFFHETAEPTLDEVPLEVFLHRFPEGEYEFETITLDGIEQDGEAEFTHDIPAGPVILTPGDGEEVDPDEVMVTWEPVTMTTAFNPPQVPVTIVAYQVIVTREDPLRELSMFVGPDVTEVSIPPEFFDPETEYELEILAIEESDNQTISVIFFETE